MPIDRHRFQGKYGFLASTLVGVYGSKIMVIAYVYHQDLQQGSAMGSPHGHARNTLGRATLNMIMLRERMPGFPIRLSAMKNRVTTAYIESFCPPSKRSILTRCQSVQPYQDFKKDLHSVTGLLLELTSKG